MKTVTLGVSSMRETKRRLAAAFRGKPQGKFISFASVELLWRTLTLRRWELLRAMTGRGAMTIRELARALDRDVKAVHGDVHASLDAGVLDRSDNGRVLFPYDAVHVDFMLTTDAA